MSAEICRLRIVMEHSIRSFNEAAAQMSAEIGRVWELPIAIWAASMRPRSDERGNVITAAAISAASMLQ